MTKSPPTSESYAAELASMLAACWPRTRVSDETCLVWAKLFQGVGENIAEEAVDRASRFDGPPSKVELDTVIRVARETIVPELPLAPESTGRTITLDEWRHGSFHLHRYWNSGETRDLREPEEFEVAMRPWECECEDWTDWTPPNPRVRDTIYEPKVLAE